GNLYTDTGDLVFVARRTQSGGYTSARIRTIGKQEFLYGRFEARARIPSTPGVWPAIWMLPQNAPGSNQALYGTWPKSGELDIMESADFADKIQGTAHFGFTFPGVVRSGGQVLGDFDDGYHVFAMEWDPDSVRWFLDGVQYHEMTSAQWFSESAPGNSRAPFDQPFYLLMNIAVGGNFPELSPDFGTWPQEMRVDYVRVYQRNQRGFGGVSGAIPGRIEAEAYDLGGAGVAYEDSDPTNNGGAFRPDEGVDIQAIGGGGFNVGWIEPGEWIEYTVNISSPGTYRVTSRVASDSGGGSFRLEFDGVDRTGDILAPDTGGWQTWTQVASDHALPGGLHVMRFQNTSDQGEGFNIDWIDFELLAVDCGADVNSDGVSDGQDFDAFLQIWSLGCVTTPCSADLDD
ncbi:MAG: carbohydrate-binding protein, partial [Planctomycetota bacterium]